MKEDQLSALRVAALQECEEETIGAAQVIEYLRANPDFFMRNDDILLELQLPHRAGAAVSLVERQVAVLRERNIESRHRLARLLETARENDHLFARTRHLVLSLLEAGSPAQMLERLGEQLRREFGADQSRAFLIEDAEGQWPTDCPRIAREQAMNAIGASLRAARPVVGPLRAQEKMFLFDDSAAELQSGAIVTVGEQMPCAVFALASRDARRFHAEMGTLFLEFIAQVLQRLLSNNGR